MVSVACLELRHSMRRRKFTTKPRRKKNSCLVTYLLTLRSLCLLSSDSSEPLCLGAAATASKVPGHRPSTPFSKQRRSAVSEFRPLKRAAYGWAPWPSRSKSTWAQAAQRSTPSAQPRSCRRSRRSSHRSRRSSLRLEALRASFLGHFGP